MNYQNLTFGELLELKKALSNINNILTQKLTLASIEKLFEDDFIERDQALQMIGSVVQKSVNANGYDIESKDNNNKGWKNIVVEVKCNLPNHGKLLANQIDNLKDDVNGLWNGKGGLETTNFIKILVVFDDGTSVVYNSLEHTFENKISEYVKGTLDTKRVYVIALTTPDIEGLLNRMQNNFFQTAIINE